MKKATLLFLATCLAITACKDKPEGDSASDETDTETATTVDTEPFFKLSLAQWSLHRRYKAEDAKPFEFAADAKELGFDAVEYVSQLYNKQIEEYGLDAVVDSLKAQQEEHGVACVLIMVDGEGDLADPDEAARNEAVENHKKWVDATAELGGHAIRVNTFGTNDPQEWLTTVQDGLKKLSEYAATKNINVLAENHGWLSSNAPLVMEAINGVNMENCGTLPDFGNWCIKRAGGERWGECEEEFPDYYAGLRILMPRAKAVSAKAYSFDANGDEEKLDYYRMVQIVKEAGYTGHIGVEYESETLDEPTGIKATRDLLIKAASNLQ